MKFQFKIQPFQTEAAQSVVQVFAGQPKGSAARYRRDVGERTGQAAFSDIADELESGYRNPAIDFEKVNLLKNVQAVQTANNIRLSSKLEEGLGAVSLDIEMETGTGKTYVYIKTMYELNKAYGWSKFIVVVPSIAIREGVKKSFEITQDHFMEQYGHKARFFVYNSKNLHQLDEFSQNAGLSVMIINTQAFNTTLNEEKNVTGRGGNEAARIIYTKRDEFGSRRPIDVIKANHPIVILDEPQKMAGAATQNALKKNFNPLFSLNYSATHKTSHNLVYVLDALDAYKKKLVKKIEVKGFEVSNLAGTSRYLYLAQVVVDAKKPPRARVQIEVGHKSGIKREYHILNEGDSLYPKSKEMEQYRGIFVTHIDPRANTITLSEGSAIRAGEAIGESNESNLRRIQIRETIESHLNKEESLLAQGIKSLSLFFIDEVAKYRQYDEAGNELLGEYGVIFEEEYLAALDQRRVLVREEGADSHLKRAHLEYLDAIDVGETHAGYFSIDKGRAVNSATVRGSDISDDITAYDLILKEKELLLSLDQKTRFIFSHSALREGWDNPNVFQICTLKQSDNTTVKRQEVGRGLRLCVNSEGERQDIDVCGETQVHEVNQLTVIASDSYRSFVAGLQSEIREGLYERPTKASEAYFAGKSVSAGDEVRVLSQDDATGIYFYLISNQYIDRTGKVLDKYRSDSAANTLAPIEDALAPYSQSIHRLVEGIFDPSVLDGMIGDGNVAKIRENPLNDNWAKFKDLWERINRKYAYTVNFDSDELVEKCVAAIGRDLHVATLRYTVITGEQDGAEFNIRQKTTLNLDRAQGSLAKYDIVGKIASGTTLTRRTVQRILAGITQAKRNLFLANPEAFIAGVVNIINREKASAVVEHITYNPSAEEPYDQNIFNMSRASEEYTKAFQAKKAIQEYVFTDGTAERSVERRFAEDLDVADEVIVYAKLPKGRRGYYIPTPVGDYSPDWAITFKKGSVKHIFFIAETKGTMDSLELRPIEQAKISCAKKLFNDLSTSEVKYHDVDSFDMLLSVMESL